MSQYDNDSYRHITGDDAMLFRHTNSNRHQQRGAAAASSPSRTRGGNNNNNQICRFWNPQTQSGCRFGDACRFVHQGSTFSMSMPNNFPLSQNNNDSSSSSTGDDAMLFRHTNSNRHQQRGATAASSPSRSRGGNNNNNQIGNNSNKSKSEKTFACSVCKTDDHARWECKEPGGLAWKCHLCGEVGRSCDPTFNGGGYACDACVAKNDEHWRQKAKREEEEQEIARAAFGRQRDRFSRYSDKREASSDGGGPWCRSTGISYDDTDRPCPRCGGFEKSCSCW